MPICSTTLSKSFPQTINWQAEWVVLGLCTWTRSAWKICPGIAEVVAAVSPPRASGWTSAGAVQGIKCRGYEWKYLPGAAETLRLKAFPRMLVHHIFTLQFYEVNMRLCLPYASIQCGLQGEDMRSSSVLIAHLEYIQHLTHFFILQLFKIQGCGWHINEVLVFKHLTPVLTLKLLSGRKHGRTQQFVWLSVCTAADQKFWKQKSWMEKIQKVYIKTTWKSWLNWRKRRGGNGQTLQQPWRVLKLDGAWCLMEITYKDPHILIPTRSHVHEAQFFCSYDDFGRRECRIMNHPKHYWDKPRERDRNVQAEIACGPRSPCLHFRSELLRQAFP